MGQKRDIFPCASACMPLPRGCAVWWVFLSCVCEGGTRRRVCVRDRGCVAIATPKTSPG